MTTTFPAVVFLIGAIAFFNFAVKLRHFSPRETAFIPRPRLTGGEAAESSGRKMDLFCRGLVQVGRSVPFDGLRIQAERLPTRGMIDRML